MGYASLRFLLPKEDMNMDKISVIVPCYNEEEVLPLFHKEVLKNLKRLKILIMKSYLLMMVVMIIQLIY